MPGWHPTAKCPSGFAGRLSTLWLHRHHGTGKQAGLPCRSRRHQKKKSREALLQGQVRPPFRWGQRGCTALSGEPAAGSLSPSSSSCVSNESMISQAPEQLDVEGSLLLP